MYVTTMQLCYHIMVMFLHYHNVITLLHNILLYYIMLSTDPSVHPDFHVNPL